jgi:RNA polymerase sigma-70 factor (ECF subfamily)
MDSKKITDLWHDYYPKVFGYFFRRVERREDAEDLTLVVLKKFFDAIDKKGDSIENLNAYLWQIAKNQLYYFFKTRSRQPFSTDQEQNLESAAMSLDAYRSKKYQERVEALLSCLKRFLKPVDYTIVYESLVQERKSYEVADIVELTADNVRKRLSRSLKKVRDKCRDSWFSD